MTTKTPWITAVKRNGRHTLLDQDGKPITLNLIASASRAALGGGVVSDVRARIAAAGGTIGSLHLDALNAYVGDLVASSLWPKLIELWVPLGDQWAAAMVKLKVASGGASALTNSNGVTTAEADYKVLNGVQFVANGTGTNKKLGTGLNPRTYFNNTVGQAWGLGIFTPSLTWNGIPIGAETNAELYVGNGGTSNMSATINNKNGSMGGAAANNGAIAHGGWRATQYGADGVGRNWVNGCGEQTFSGTSPSAPANAQIVLASCNNGFWSDAALQGYAIFTELTQEEMQTLAQFFLNVNEAVGRDAYRKEYCANGDSITAGNGATNAATDRRSVLVANRLGLVESNQGHSGSRMGTQIAAVENYSILNNQVQHLLGRRPLFWSIAHGINDISQVDDLDAVLLEYDNVMTRCKQANLIMENGMLCAPAYLDPVAYMARYPNSKWTQSRRDQFAAGVKKLAQKYGTRFVDFGEGRMKNVPGVISADDLHPSTFGYSLMAPDEIDAWVA